MKMIVVVLLLSVACAFHTIPPNFCLSKQLALKNRAPKATLQRKMAGQDENDDLATVTRLENLSRNSKVGICVTREGTRLSYRANDDGVG